MNTGRASTFFPALLLVAVLVRLGDSVRLLAEGDVTDSISSACQQTEYFDVCVSTLQSRPDSQNADVKGLALISLDACIAHAEGTLAYARQLRSNATAAAGHAGDDYATRCLDDCLTQYSDALDDLTESVADAQDGAYGSVNARVSGAMTDSDSCEDGFAEQPGYSSPLTERNDFFSKLCSNALAITRLLS
ncbi:unnamed protein product [Spirodela intermedia]|uniref:Pectinesterase inhibitor domain-containing protein n=1 Tax=Spirodela intermedia TaxID=51605 RepID=A0A7I8J2Z0_SPIIN|nr:unnamed protein product [Spirodela intermedia]CAA6664576.1 unnamed protein product [Spirodela intermedia]